MDRSTRVDGPSRLPAGLTVTGDLSSSQDLTIDGSYDGQINLSDQHLTVGTSGRVKGRIVARASGTSSGAPSRTKSFCMSTTTSAECWGSNAKGSHSSEYGSGWSRPSSE